ncbi:hypothetical protein EOS_41605 [Caballeronia mineralivorans PML1(12)]|uniref:Uncharacterized protein n=2 Tax=Caballeronia mineralivorans TaxID=2010198 RepID=A0A0J1CIQ8_9BURK|nr:hypothetical protein EOS_41605 [Caballeronia mineralivorans PML1(12)]
MRSQLPAAERLTVDFVEVQLVEKLEKPLIFQWGAGGAEQPPSVFKGFDAAVLIDLRNAIISANSAGCLSARYEKILTACLSVERVASAACSMA